MRVMNHNWSATKQHFHPQSVAEISRYSVLSGQDSTMWDIVRVSPQEHRSVSVSHHFLLQAPQCPYFVRKRLSRDYCCRGRLKPGSRPGSKHYWTLNTRLLCCLYNAILHILSSVGQLSIVAQKIPLFAYTFWKTKSICLLTKNQWNCPADMFIYWFFCHFLL